MRRQHCRHCLGDCPGDCLIPGIADDEGLCIHKPYRRRPLRAWLALARTASLRRRLFSGVLPHRPGR